MLTRWPPPSHPSQVLACARADARFHALALAALAVPVQRADGVWWGLAPVAPYFMSAGTLEATATSRQVLDAVADLPQVWQVRDCWSRVDLTPGGFTPTPDDPWMVRLPGTAAVRPSVPGLEIRRAVTAEDVAIFEWTAVRGTGDPVPPDFRDGDLHPASTPTDGDLHLFTGFLDGEPVATALAAVGPTEVMVGAVRTRPDVRGRGIGSALTLAALEAAPDRPAALGARARAVPMYERLGFAVCGQARLWRRPRSSSDQLGQVRAGTAGVHRQVVAQHQV